MKQLYLECNMGAAGDMLMGALYDICPDREAFLRTMAELNIPGVHLHADTVQKSGIGGVSVTVHIHGQEETSCDVPLGQRHPHSHGDEQHTHDHSHPHTHDHPHTHLHDHEHDHTHSHGEEHAHNSMTDIRSFIENAPVSERVRESALGVYRLIAEAEASVHGTTPEQVHFHEVGTLDALADILGCCILMEMIAPDHIVCSPIHVGSGQVRCAHGILPVPAPATARILEGIPIYSGDIRGELCTPTGAALLRYFADSFGSMPAMVLEKTGYGFGKKEFPVVNCLRVMLGHAGGSARGIMEIRCNIDDMTGEALGVAQEILMDHGALDVFFTPVQMKKNRPAVVLTCLCKPDEREKFAQLMLEHTTTLGVRMVPCSRIVMDWQVIESQTPFGKIRIKQSEGYGIKKIKPEFDDVKAAAETYGVSFDEVYYVVMRNEADKK